MVLVLVAAQLVFLSIHFLVCCAKKKQFPNAFVEGYSAENRGSVEGVRGSGEMFRGSGEGFRGSGEVRDSREGGSREKLDIRPPEQKIIVATQDPNYQTLAGLNNADIFQNKGGGGGLGIRPPAQGNVKMVGTYDPNYQTLAGLANEDIFKRKDKPPGGGPNFIGLQPGGFGGGGGIKPPPPLAPGQGKMAGTYDPNYQTLAGLNNDDVFKPKGGGFGAKPAGQPWGSAEAFKAPQARPPGGAKMAATFDPNYQTLAGLNNDDVFKPKGGGFAGPARRW